MNRFYPFSYSLLGALLLLLGACSQESPQQDSTDHSDPARQETFQSFHLDLPAEEDADAIEEQVSDARALKLDLTQGTTVPIVPKLNRNGIKDSVQTVVSIYNKTKGLSFSTPVWWVKETRPRILPNAYYYMRDVELPASMTANIDTDEWYIIAVAGGGNYAAGSQRLSVTGITNLQPVRAGQQVEWEAPFATPWRRMSWDKAHKRFILQSMTQVMKFRPQGIYLVLQVENRANFGVKITREMSLEANGYASQGYYDFSAASIKKHPDQVSDGRDAIGRLWVTTNSETAASRASAAFRDQTRPHYMTKFTLQPATGEARGAISLAKRPDAGTPTRYTPTYVLWLQKIDPYWDRAASDASGNDEKNIIYAPVEVDEPGRDLYVPRRSVRAYPYNQDPQIHRWKPYLGSRYIIGSIAHGVQEGKAHKKTLRVVRPFLPIEYTGPEIFYSARRDLDNKAPWRRPYNTEIAPLLRIPTDLLQRAQQQAPTNPHIANWTPVSSVDLGGEIGITQYDFNNFPWETQIGTVIYNQLSWMFSRRPGSDVIYGIGYRNYQENNGRWRDKTNNYAVAIRITLNIPHNRDDESRDIAKNGGGNRRENAKIEHYYLGPNFNVGRKPATAASYVMTPQFWQYCIDEQAIISRVLPFKETSRDDDGVHYWVWPPANNWRLDKVAINNKSDIHYKWGGLPNQSQWNQPWLDKAAW